MAPVGQVVKDFTLARVNLIVGAHAIVQRLRQGTPLILARDPKDIYDPQHAIMVFAIKPNRKIGYLPIGLAEEVAPLMDAGVTVIARKAPNPLYGVCQVAWIPPAGGAGIDPAAQSAMATDHYPSLPEGVTQADLDAATEMPPVGDSRRPKPTITVFPDGASHLAYGVSKQKDVPDDESPADPADQT